LGKERNYLIFGGEKNDKEGDKDGETLIGVPHSGSQRTTIVSGSDLASIIGVIIERMNNV
jgi:hypothetical protein